MTDKEISEERQLGFMKKLSFVREAGRPGEKKAAGLLEEELRALGQKPRTEAFSFTEFEPEKVSFSVTEPYRKSYPAAAVLNGGNTPEEGIEAALFYAEDGDEISISQTGQKLALINPKLTPALCRSFCEAGARGALTVCGSPLDQVPDRTPVSYDLPDKSPKFPAAVLHYLDAREILERGAKSARLTVLQHQAQHSSQNVAVRIEGTDRREEILSLSAHYDSVAGSCGAYDNLAGASIVLELCRYFAEHRARRTMEFIWFGAEEKGLRGSRAYVKEHRKELSRHRFNMNVDLAGQMIGGNVIGITGSEDVETVIRELMERKRLGCSFKRKVWESDSNSFAWAGIPAMTLDRDGFGMHTKHDTMDLISGRALSEGCRLLGTIAWTLANADVFPFPRSVPDQMRETIARWYEEPFPKEEG